MAPLRNSAAALLVVEALFLLGAGTMALWSPAKYVESMFLHDLSLRDQRDALVKFTGVTLLFTVALLFGVVSASNASAAALAFPNLLLCDLLFAYITYNVLQPKIAQGDNFVIAYVAILAIVAAARAYFVWTGVAAPAPPVPQRARADGANATAATAAHPAPTTPPLPTANPASPPTATKIVKSPKSTRARRVVKAQE